MDVIEYLRSQNVAIHMREKGNLYLDCPTCGKDNLSVSRDNGAWHCWTGSCGQKGNFKQLLNLLKIEGGPTISFRHKDEKQADKKLTVEQIEALERFKANKAEIINWAVSRSLDPTTVLTAGVGYDKEQEAVVYSYKDERGQLIGYKCKNDRGQWTVGKEPLLYAVDMQDLRKEKLILVEGEADVLTLKSMGLPAVATLGATKEKGFELLTPVRRIFIGYDMDPAGQAGGQVASEKLGLYKCRHVEWGGKDVNDWVQMGATKNDILECLKNSTKYIEGNTTISAMDAVGEYFEQHEAGMRPRRSWGWPKLDAFTKGWSGGELIAVHAESNTGKTTWLLNVMRNFAHQGIACGLVSLEEHPLFEVTPKLYSCVLGKNINTYGLSRKEAETVKDELKQVRIYKDKCDLKKILDFARECYYEHDVKCIAIDYFQLLVSDEESTQAVKETIWALKSLTVELPDLMVLLVVQPKQVDQPQDDDRNKDGSKRRKKKLGGWSMRGGAVINQTIDKCIVISGVKGHPNTTQYEFTKCRGHLDVDRSQWVNRQMQLEYDHDTMRMIERNHLIYDL
jgi:hypothetical protein